MAGYLSLVGLITGSASGTINIGPFSVPVNPSNQFAITAVTLTTSAYNSIAVPSWAYNCIINPSVSNVTGMTLKGATGDTGISIAVNEPMMINFVPGSTPATIGILTAGAFSTITQFIFC